MLDNRLEKPLLSGSSRFLDSIKGLSDSPSYLWITLCIKFTSFAAFSVIAVISSLYLTKVQKFSEKEAGLIFASLGLAIALYSVVLSNLAKYIGLRGTLMLGNLMGSLGYLLVLLFKDRLIQILIILVFIMFAISINLTNTKLGIKYYTYPKSRSLAYTLYYLVFFVSAGFASGGVDFLTFLFPETVYTWIFSFGLGLYLITFVLSCFLAEIDLENEEPEKIQVMTAAEVVKVKGFWNFVAFIFVMMVIKSVYFHLTGTLPVYMDRRVENGSHFGLMMVIQQVILLAATPVCSYLVFYWDKYTIIVVGTFFTAASPLAMYYDQTYVGIVACVVIISVGESIYAPRLVDYAVEVAPKGAEAIYLGIAAVTNSLPLIITGITSALLMDRYCKADSDKSECHMVWLWIGGYAVSAVGTLFLFRRWIESHAV